MRGLETRLTFAKAIVHLSIDEHCMDANSEMLDALMDAQSQGYHDYRRGIDSVPITFHDARPLVCAWHTGVVCAIESEEMADCGFCNDDTGNPCPTHG